MNKDLDFLVYKDLSDQLLFILHISNKYFSQSIEKYVGKNFIDYYCERHIRIVKNKNDKVRKNDLIIDENEIKIKNALMGL